MRHVSVYQIEGSGLEIRGVRVDDQHPRLVTGPDTCGRREIESDDVPVGRAIDALGRRAHAINVESNVGLKSTEGRDGCALNWVDRAFVAGKRVYEI